ncbi:MAG: type III-B CRISPR-associated protein Cas10/Cmr2 [Pontiellaceae bacterium]|nr:type III-B CRISPR-associated protein Cas10/Cmr2 [Pontiellaceae bacterium]
MNEQFWKLKLMAFLHDPPCKALDFSKTHEEIAMGFVKAALPGEDNQAWHGWMSGLKDSDWFASEADRIGGFGKGAHVTTFGNGSKFKHPLGNAEYMFRAAPTLGKAAEILQDVQKGIRADPDVSPSDQARQAFFFHWRRWMEESVRSQDGKGRELAFFPADTRIPDHTIWNHMAVASALQGCRDDNKNIRASFLLFQIGPVQEFIAQARSTRDLWCGSYLLSWLTATAIKAITDELGPDHLVFPALRAQGVFDALHQELYNKISYGGDSLWQRLYKDGSVEDRIDSARRLLSPTLPNRFFALVPQGREKEFADKARQAIDLELHRISECCWKQFCKLAQVEDRNHLSNMKQRWDRQVDLFVQTSWAAERLDKIGDWQETFETVSKRLAARRNTRDFDQFVTDDYQRTARKDVLSGKEEVIGDENVWKALSQTDAFKEEGPYGALTIIKRLWCRTETEGGLLKRLHIGEDIFKKALRMDSLPAIAASNNAKGTDDKPKNPYIAVIALDGDQIGKWLSGENMPDVKDLVADGLKDCVSGKRKLTPSYHAQFSEALANFATHLAKRVVEGYQGLLVYAGGDDVLCIVPADKALDCAADLRALFRGEAEALSQKQNQYELGITQDGFVLADEYYPLIVPGPAMDASCGIVIGHCKHPLQALVREAQRAEKRAKSTYAKDEKGEYKGGAFAISLMKRSGEIIHWGARWNQVALAVYRDFTQKTDDEKISGRFPYALAELLKPYRLKEEPQVELKPIIGKEFGHVQSQQAQVKGTMVEGALDYLKELPDHRLEDFPNLFLASAFINRQRGEN